jgi:hypothetical protein
MTSIGCSRQRTVGLKVILECRTTPRTSIPGCRQPSVTRQFDAGLVYLVPLFLERETRFKISMFPESKGSPFIAEERVSLSFASGY